MLRMSLLWKIVAPITLASAAALFFFGDFSIQKVRQSLAFRERTHLQMIANRLAGETEILQAAWRKDRNLAARAIDRTLQRNPNLYRIELFARDDSSSMHYRPVHSHGPVSSGSLPRWRYAIFSDVQEWKEGDLEGMLAVAPVLDLEEVKEGKGRPERMERGVILVWAGKEPVEAAIVEYVRSIFPVGMAVVISSMAFALLVTLRVTRSIRGLTKVAEKLGSGGEEVVIDTRGRDEISRLASSLMAMSRRLAQARNQIEYHNHTLEHKVEERTRELRVAYEELKTLDRAKDSFLSSVSHELRTPLTSIRSYSEILLDYGEEESEETKREFLTIIKDESERLSRLINQVLDLAKIEAGKMSWERERFDLRELVQQTVRVQEGLVKIKPVEFALRLPEREAPFDGDKDRLHQVLTNLLSNAWKVSPPGGVISILLEEFVGGFELRVDDQGPGVPGRRGKRRIFEKFRQMGDTLTGKPEGTGLGLPISKEIVLMHGGYMGCLDAPGGGARLQVLLPKKDPGWPRPLDRAFEHPGKGGWPEGLNPDPRRSIFRVPAVR